MLGSIFTSHACELVIASKLDVVEAKKHIQRCLFKRHDLVIEGTPTDVHRLCHEVRRLLLELVAKYIPKNDNNTSVSGTLISDLPPSPYRGKNKYVLLEADEIFRAHRLLQSLLLTIKRLEQNTKGSFTPPPLPRSLAPSKSPSSSPLRRVLSTPTTTSLNKIQINPLTFGGHYCHYTPYKNYDVSMMSEGKHRVVVMENMDEHPFDLVRKRLAAIGSSKKQCLVIGSRTMTQKPLIREYNELNETKPAPKIQGEEEKSVQIEKITKLVEWSYWIRVECRVYTESPSSSPLMGASSPLRPVSLFKEDGDFDEL